MKQETFLRIITPIVLGLLILSLFSGIAAAQLPQGEQNLRDKAQNIRDKAQNIRDRYQENKEKFDNTKKQFEYSRKVFEDAKRQFVKENKSGDISKDFIEKAREYLLKAIGHTESQLQVMKDRLDNPENKGIRAQDAEKLIDAHMTQLEQLKTKVESATTIKELRDAHKELAGIVAKINIETRYFLGMVLNIRIDNFIARADNVSIKMDNAIAKLEANGEDTTRLRAEADDFKDKIREAKDLHAQTKALYETHNGFGSDGSVISEKDAREFLKQANELQRDTIKSLREGGRQLIEFGKDFRKLGKVRVNEKGDLEVNGGVTATMTGGVTATLTGQ